MTEIVYSRTALKVLARMPCKWANRTQNKIRDYAENPASQMNNVIYLKGKNGFVRLWVGDWRIVMRHRNVLNVLHVTSRGSAYKE